MMTEEELKKRCLQYMQAQLEQTFDQDNIPLCSSKTSTKSIEVEHFYSPLDKSEINFSKIIIREILLPQTWGLHPNRARLMKFGERQISFNYWDYVFAFQNMFYYENSRLKAFLVHQNLSKYLIKRNNLLVHSMVA